MSSFESITQFINTNNSNYNKLYYNKNACHFFSLKTAFEFFLNYDLSKNKHESNILFAIDKNIQMQNNQLYFDDVIQFTSLSLNDIYATSTDLIKNNEYPIDFIFPDTSNPYCVIILKNSKYFVVIHYNSKFYLRDCHEPFQYDFNNKFDLINHLNNVYQFNNSINLDGYIIPEFSSIEYIIIDNPFMFS